MNDFILVARSAPRLVARMCNLLTLSATTSGAEDLSQRLVDVLKTFNPHDVQEIHAVFVAHQHLATAFARSSMFSSDEFRGDSRC